MDRPILFNTAMAQAVLDGRKTVTRRLLKLHYRDDESGFNVVSNTHTGEFVRVEKTNENGGGIFADGSERYVAQPAYVRDVLWVRETWCEALGRAGKYFYRAYPGERDEMKEYAHSFNRWRPSIHMPKAAARLFLRVTGVRVERLQEILARPGEVAKEGIPYEDDGDREASGLRFKELWDSTIKPADRDSYGWDANPWVWVIEFERCERPGDWLSQPAEED